MQEVHGHSVIETLQSTAKDKNREEIITLIEDTFGKECTFYNCSQKGMSVSDIITFFENKGKITFSEDGFAFGQPSGCHH